MKAAVFRGVGNPLSIEAVPDPVPGEGEIIVEVSRAGICGSDLHWTETPDVLRPGTILGHEFAGTIADANGTGLAVGARVTALPICPCWHCDECYGGHIFHCTEPQVIGLQRAGAFATALAVDARLVQRLPDGVTFDEGALIEPLAVGFRTVSHARVGKDENILVMGAGPIGSAVILFAALRGAKIVVSEPSPGRREMAMAIGATATIDPRNEDVGARFHQICGSAPDIVVECVGIPGVIAEAIRLVRPRGQIISAGGCYLTDSFLPIDALTKELVINFSCAYEVADFEGVIDALAKHRIQPKPLITDRIVLEELPARFEALRRPSTQCKILVGLD